MPRETYHPRTSRTKLPLSVADQRMLVDKADGHTKTLLLLFLSTGMHPLCLSKTKRYGLSWDQLYISWVRTKNKKKCMFAWSNAMKTPGVLDSLWSLKNKSRQWYFILIKELGKENGIPGLCPLQLRHNYFINRGRLGHNIYDISHSSGTSMDTVYNHYTIGLNEGKAISDEDRGFLRWLMEG